jgi:hypothetical protein
MTTIFGTSINTHLYIANNGTKTHEEIDTFIEATNDVLETISATNTSITLGASDRSTSLMGSTISIGTAVTPTNIMGDLTVNGTTTTVNTETLLVEDSMVTFGHNNPADLVDSGMLIEYQDSGTKYAGIIRDKSEASTTWKCVNGLSSDLTATANNTSTLDAALTNFHANRLICDTLKFTGTGRVNISGSFSDGIDIGAGDIRAEGFDLLKTSGLTDLLIGATQADAIVIGKPAINTKVLGTITVDDIDNHQADILHIGKSTATKVEIGASDIISEVKGILHCPSDATTDSGVYIGSSTTQSSASGFSQIDMYTPLTLTSDTTNSALVIRTTDSRTNVVGADQATFITKGITFNSQNHAGYYNNNGPSIDCEWGPDYQNGMDCSLVFKTVDASGTPAAGLMKLDRNGNLTTNGILTVDELDAQTATTLKVGKTTATKIEIGATGITTEVKGDLIIKSNVPANSGSAGVVGTVTYGSIYMYVCISSVDNPKWIRFLRDATAWA